MFSPTVGSWVEMILERKFVAQVGRAVRKSCSLVWAISNLPVLPSAVAQGLAGVPDDLNVIYSAALL